jgi:hypothetical protein
VVFIYALALLMLAGCSRSEARREQAIKLVKETIKQNPLNFLGMGLDLAFSRISGQKEKFQWSARETDKRDVYLVSLKSTATGMGYYWEVNLKTKQVRYVNENRYLCLKYGLSRKDRSGKFKVKVIKNNIVLDSRAPRKKEATYWLEGYIRNNTKYTITRACLSCTLNIVYRERTVRLSSGGEDFAGFCSSYLFQETVSMDKPWKPGELRKFRFIKGVSPIYLFTYKPRFIITDVKLTARDPLGFSYRGVIDELPVLPPVTKTGNNRSNRQKPEEPERSKASGV